MERFRRGETKALISTTVIEVGVDVPNATVILIENSERFGLAQLHQLRVESVAASTNRIAFYLPLSRHQRRPRN